jgi:double-stranded uracil-DNA glycosylase
MNPIPDHLKTNLKILFIGYNPSLKSAETGHHYANPHNRFWRLLYQSCLTSRLYLPIEDQDLLTYGYGFTNIVERPTRTAEDITREEYQMGREQLHQKILFYCPKIACFVGKGVYEQYRKQRNISWGIQHESSTPEVLEFVVPSSSGLVRMPYAEILQVYQELKSVLDTQFPISS